MKKTIVTCVVSLLAGFPLSAQYVSDIRVTSDVRVGTGDTSPFWFTANQHGLGSIQPNSAYLRAGIFKTMRTDRRFDFAYGLDLAGGYHLDANVIVQQAYVDLRYRSLFLSMGSKERDGLFRNPLLSTGGTLWSGNARPIPQLRAGFYDWVRPFRADWFALKGDFSYGWFTDQNFQKEFISKENGVYVKGIVYHHKYIAFKFGTEQT
ncbi:MAG: capsule assembly Wzi family protein, partial [Bacteroidales bacterium]